MTNYFSTRFAILLAVVAVLWASANEAAADKQSTEPDEALFDFDWENVTDDPNRQEFERLMKRGRRAILEAVEARSRRESMDFALGAADLFARAAKLRPKDPKPHLYASEAIMAWDELTYSFPKRLKQTIYHLGEFIRLAPFDSRVSDALFSRSIALTKLGGDENIRLALADYDQRLRMHNQLSLNPFDRSNLGLIYSNSAELHMYVGELDRALALYYDSLEYASGARASLYRYGLAVALDRDRQDARARAIMRRAIKDDPDGPLGQLVRKDVFFIPEGDIHYYRGLGYDALGDERKALTHYRRFIRVLPQSRYAERANENIARLEASTR